MLNCNIYINEGTRVINFTIEEEDKEILVQAFLRGDYVSIKTSMFIHVVNLGESSDIKFSGTYSSKDIAGILLLDRVGC